MSGGPAVLILLAALADQSAEDPLIPHVEALTAEQCYDHVQILASPEFGGRGTPSPGLDLAAAYLEARLADLGMEPAGPEQSYRLPYAQRSLLPGKDAHFTWQDEEGERWSADPLTGFVPVPGSREGGVSGEPVFVGYAIDAREERWEDLPKRRVEDRIVFAFTREPRADDPKWKRFNGADLSEHAVFRTKAHAAAKAGARALVLVGDPVAYPDGSRPVSGLLPLPLARGMEIDRISRNAAWPDIPVVAVSREIAEAVFETDLVKYHTGIDNKRKPRLLKAPKKRTVDLSVRWAEDDVELFNLAARLPGSEDDGEVVILGAHLDHVGFNVYQTLWGGQFVLHPGADDNASGSAALLAVAEALAGSEPKEDILFLWFTGEEIGLLGSQAYCREPLYPHENTIAMLNMDMVGRGESKKAYVAGLWDLPDWEKLVRRAAKRIRSKLDLELDQGRDIYARSDQYSFHQQGVVALFYYEGPPDANKLYHKPTDVPESIDGEKMERIADLLLASVYPLAYEGVRP